MAATIITLSTHTNFPIQLTSDNFTSWRKQVLATLTGLELEQFVDGLTAPPPKILEGKPNPAYRLWVLQDQILLGALLGSCSATILPIVSSAETSLELFKRLTETYAGVSRSRIISLRSKLATTVKGNKPVADYLREMKAIADELALAQKPVDEDDLIVHIITHLGDDYKQVTAAVKMRDTPITFSDLFEKLVDHERTLLEAKPVITLTTVNNTQRQGPRFSYSRSQSDGRHYSEPRSSYRTHNFGPRSGRPQQNNSSSLGYRTNKHHLFCHFCNIAGHDTKECRKLTRFLQDHHISTPTPSSTNPTTNSSMATSSHTLPSMFDSGASNHAAYDPSLLHSLSEYGGPDEIVLGNSTKLSISHIGQTSIPTTSRHLKLKDVLLVPKLRNNIVSVSKLCKTNQVSVEFFPFHFIVKDLHTGARLMRGVNINDVYYARRFLPLPLKQINSSSTTSGSLLSWHHKLGHPSIKILKRLLNNLGPKCTKMSTVSFQCDACSLHKSHKMPFGSNSFKVTKPLELIYSDVWGPVQQSHDGYTYYVIFVEYHTKYTWLYPIKRKSDVSTLFPQFKTLVEIFFTTRLSLFSRTTKANTLALFPTFNNMAFPTLQHLHIPRNKMGLPNDTIVTLLKPGYLSYIMPPYRFNFGLMLFKLRLPVTIPFSSSSSHLLTYAAVTIYTLLHLVLNNDGKMQVDATLAASAVACRYAGCPLDLSGFNITRAAVICSNTDARASCCRYINALIASSIARYANTTNNLGVSPELSNTCLQNISQTLELYGLTKSATAFCGFGTKISVNYECLGITTVNQMQQSPIFSNVTQYCGVPLGEESCKMCINAGILFVRNLVKAVDNMTLSICRDATFVAVASQVDDVAAIVLADCFFGVQGLSGTPVFTRSSPPKFSPESSPSPVVAVGPSQFSLTIPQIRHHSYHLSLVPAVGIAVTALATMMLILMVFLIRRKTKELKGHEMTTDKNSMENVSPPKKKFQEGPSSMLTKFSYKETKKATNNFKTIIGQGGFGTVYKAQFIDGSVVAVKHMDKVSEQAVEEFCREILLLARLHHRHLVALKGFCIEKHERFLMYEYMANGSLKDHLHTPGVVPLSWHTRIQIAIDVANALEYLHFYCDPPLCHRDIKSSNILLDEKFVGKVADFGLAFASKDGSICFEPVNTEIRGTPG
ncbi:hypothetical protein E3N88_34302 [Mikania micrantha]|uniref:Protein kinase domain-containing protein n=1 Tax=Mikania micrantha TaxID=192012 RepID=A0A5N6LY48_9ASTR|nr:hypothetical protein E3N88_34302 [Mikania micrantha]